MVQYISYCLSRLRTQFFNWFGLALRKRKSIHFVTISGEGFKRVQTADSTVAIEIEQNLLKFQRAKIFPELATRYEHEIWVEFVEGTRPRQTSEELALRLADFYAEVYRASPRLVDVRQTPFPARLRGDLTFLRRVKVLSEPDFVGLIRASVTLSPDSVWVGYDYTDPVLMNFVLRTKSRSLCAVDVEGLVGNSLIGAGTVKASIRWLGEHKNVFYQRLTDAGTPSFHTYLPFVELYFIAEWTKRNIFEGKDRKIDRRLFNRFLG